MNDRDHFAASMPEPHFYARILSKRAQEALAGPEPARPTYSTDESPALVDYYTKLFLWELRLHAKIRYLYADAMLNERDA